MRPAKYISINDEFQTHFRLTFPFGSFTIPLKDLKILLYCRKYFFKLYVNQTLMTRERQPKAFLTFPGQSRSKTMAQNEPSYDFLSIINSNSVVILNRFGDIGH